MKNLLILMCIFSSQFAFSAKSGLIIKGFHNYYEGEDTDELFVTEINLENLKDASIQHYVFQEEEYVEEMCYYGSEEEATEIIARIIDVSTGDSWQELGTPSVEIDGTIVYPYSYVDESGDNDGLEAVVPKCK